jgi:hypothetical protein
MSSRLAFTHHRRRRSELHGEKALSFSLAAVPVSVSLDTHPVCGDARDPDRGVRGLPAVQVIRAYRGLRDTLFGPGVPFGVYADVVTPGRVGVGDSLQLP